MFRFASVTLMIVRIVLCSLRRERGHVVLIGMSGGELQHRVDGQPRQIDVRGERVFVCQRRGLNRREMSEWRGQAVRELQQWVQAERGQ